MIKCIIVKVSEEALADRQLHGYSPKGLRSKVKVSEEALADRHSHGNSPKVPRSR